MTRMQAPSHRVDFEGDKAIIRRLELFCGYDPETDVAKPEMQAFDRAKVEDMVEMTRRYMKRGQLPKIVERHAKGDKTVQDTFGSVISVEVEDRDGVPHIVGDVEMQRSYFDAKVASNAFTRRSAEFWPEGYMSEVALLGRETPMRPLRDTRFSRDGSKMVFEMESAMSVPASENATVPAYEDGHKKRKRKEKTMHNDETADIKAENDRLRAELDTLKSSKSTFERDAKATFERQMAEQKEAFDREIAAVRLEARKATFERTLDALQSDGYPVKAHRDTMLAELCDAKDADAKVAFWRSTMTKAPVGVTVNTEGSTTNGDGKATFDRDAMKELVRTHAGNPAALREALAKIA